MSTAPGVIFTGERAGVARHEHAREVGDQGGGD